MFAPRFAKTRKNGLKGAPMQDARYLRAQATLYAEMARLMTDSEAAKKALAAAADFLDRAVALEEGGTPPILNARSGD
jgi:hypothetical protein